MKKICSLLFALTLLGALTVPALADEIWFPGDFLAREGFFYEHKAECVDVRGGVSETKTETTLYSDPEEQRVVRTVPAGKTIVVVWIWKNAAGEKWGLTFDENEMNDGVWFRMEDVRKLYQYADFREAHSAEYVSESGVIPITAEKEIYLYSFPGSAASDTVGGKTDGPIYDDQNIRYDTTYTDENGVKWGLHEWRTNCFCVCVSDPYTEQPVTAPLFSDRAWPEPPGPASAEPTPPTSAEPPAGESEGPGETQTATVGNDAPPAPADPAQIEHPDVPAAPAAEQGAPVGLIVGLVAAVVAVSAVLLVILRRKK